MTRSEISIFQSPVEYYVKLVALACAYIEFVLRKLKLPPHNLTIRQEKAFVRYLRGNSEAVERYIFGSRVEKEEDKLRDYLPAQEELAHECLYEDVNKSIHPFADPFRLRLAIEYESRRYEEYFIAKLPISAKQPPGIKMG